MKLLLSVYNQILNSFKFDYEQGGILGSNNNIVVAFNLDKRHGSKQTYTPNIEKLNNIISEWHQKGITFVGLIHSHINNVGVYSNSDLEYLKNIYILNKEILDKIYFPIVYQEENGEFKINVYFYDNSGLHEDSLEIVKD